MTTANGRALATVEDVARAAGVSVATVSRVLNQSPKVAPSTRTRVLEALDQLGYAPNNLARNLRARALRVFALVIPDIRNPVYTALQRGVEDVARAAGFFVLLANTDEQPEREAEYLRMLLAERVAGVLLVPTGETHLEILESLLHVGIPVVALDRPIAGLEVDTVQPNRARGAGLAVEHLHDHGHAAIGLLNGPAEMETAQQRAEGFRAALRARGIDSAARFEVHADFHEAGGYAAAKRLLESTDRPTGLLVANNLMALGAIRAAAALRMRIPEDVALIAFDETEWAPLLAPPLTTVALAVDELGRTAAELLERRLADASRPAATVLLQPRLIVRASCGPHGSGRAFPPATVPT